MRVHALLVGMLRGHPDLILDSCSVPAKRSGDPRMEFQVGDACATPFPEASFDQLREHVRRAYLDRQPDDGPRSYAASALAVRGVVPS